MTVIRAKFRDMQRIDDAAAAWVLKERKISRETLERLGVGCGTAYFADVKQQLHCVMFPYEEGTWKARAYPTKAFTSKVGMEVTFWGLREVLNGPLDRIYVVEGEFDRCALVEAGIPSDRVLAAPGASGGPSAEMQYVKEAIKEGLAKAKRFVLCTDQDGPGLELRSSLAQIFGVARVEFIDWPEGIKDANEHLIKDGAQSLYDLVKDGALPWPAEGVYTMDEIAEPAKLMRWHPGFPDWQNKLFLAPGMLSVVTGHPGHGKTQLWSQLWFQIMQANDLVACIATFETKPKPHYQRIIRQLHGRGLLENLNDDQIRNADQWIRSHYRFIIHREERPTLEWLLGQAEIVIIRDGAKIVQVDPWNRLEATKEGRESDTDYIGRCLRSLYAFANDFKVHVQILAHPSKMDGHRRGMMPALEDIAGCYSSDTEVLTRRGFIPHADVSMQDDVACFNPDTDMLEYHRPTHLHAYPYMGEIYRVTNIAADLMITPNHRVIGSPAWPLPNGNAAERIKWTRDRWSFVEVRDIKSRWVIPLGAKLDNRPAGDLLPFTDADPVTFMEYVGWWIAEGSESMNAASICQAVGTKADRIRNLMVGCGFRFTEQVSHYRQEELPMWRARLLRRSDPGINDWILAECGVGCENKHLPSITWDLSDEAKRALFDGLIGGDGSALRNPDGYRYDTTSKRLADDMQRLAIELGHPARQAVDNGALPHHKTRYRVMIGGRDRTFVSVRPERHIAIVPYNGMVYCLTVSTGAYVTRRNGRVSICGNSKHWENMVDQGFVVHRPKLFDDNGDRVTYAELHHLKARFDALGFPAKFGLDYDVDQGRYGPCPLAKKKPKSHKEAQQAQPEEWE